VIALERTFSRVLQTKGLVIAFVVAALRCSTTEGPLIVREHAGGVEATGGSSSSSLVGEGGVGGTSRVNSIRLPAKDVSWQVQLSGSFDSTVDVSLYYVDLDNLMNSEVEALVREGRYLACYLSAGTYEPWRADAALFPAVVLGNAVVDYPTERWLDIRSSVVESLMGSRLDRMKSVGCHSVVIANVTTNGQDSGFAVTAAEQNSYLVWIGEQLHLRGLGAGLATAEDRLSQVEPYFDWAYAQQCWIESQCSAYTPFVSANKVVLAVEFGDSSTPTEICQSVRGSGINLILKSNGLGAGRIACVP
jgi:Glycoside-hydrolase family GH114